MDNERNFNCKCLLAAFAILTFVYLLSEYTIDKLDGIVDEHYSKGAVVEINVYLSDNETADSPEAQKTADKEVNSSILRAFLEPLMRDKRQAAMLPIIPGYVCSAELFKNVDPCCPTPVFLKESELQSCNRRRFARSVPANASSSTNSSETETDYEYYDEYADEENVTKARPGPQDAKSVYYKWVPIRIFRSSQRRNNARTQQRSQQTQSQQATIGRKTPTRQIISPENVLNVDLMFAAMTAMVPTSWASLLSAAKTDCANVTAGGGMIENVLDANRKVCLVAPIKLMRCIKRYLIMSCPSMLDTGPQCTMNMNILKQCDVLGL